MVVPFQYEKDDFVPGIVFDSASQAHTFAYRLQSYVKNQVAKIKGLTKEEMAGFVVNFPLNVIMHPVDADGEPLGTPTLFETIGLDE